MHASHTYRVVVSLVPEEGGSCASFSSFLRRQQDNCSALRGEQRTQEVLLGMAQAASAVEQIGRAERPQLVVCDIAPRDLSSRVEESEAKGESSSLEVESRSCDR